jgi:hypothetical protein
MKRAPVSDHGKFRTQILGDEKKLIFVDRRRLFFQLIEKTEGVLPLLYLSQGLKVFHKKRAKLFPPLFRPGVVEKRKDPRCPVIGLE